MEIDRTQCPDYFLDYILYITVTKSLSSRTVQEYYLDIRMFLKYLRMMQDPNYQNTDPDSGYSNLYVGKCQITGFIQLLVLCNRRT